MRGYYDLGTACKLYRRVFREENYVDSAGPAIWRLTITYAAPNSCKDVHREETWLQALHLVTATGHPASRQTDWRPDDMGLSAFGAVQQCNAGNTNDWQSDVDAFCADAINPLFFEQRLWYDHQSSSSHHCVTTPVLILLSTAIARRNGTRALLGADIRAQDDSATEWSWSCISLEVLVRGWRIEFRSGSLVACACARSDTAAVGCRHGASHPP